MGNSLFASIAKILIKTSFKQNFKLLEIIKVALIVNILIAESCIKNLSNWFRFCSYYKWLK